MGKLDWLRRPIAHRALHNHAEGIIENSPSAVKAAIAQNYAIEVDIQPASDLTPMVFHDAVLERLTNGKGAVNSHTPGTLKEFAFKQTNDTMQSLQELLQMVNGQVPVIMEIKFGRAEPMGFAKAISQTLSSYEGHIAIMSFDPQIVGQFVQLAPHIPRGLVATTTNLKNIPDLSRWQRFKLSHLLTFTLAKPHFIAYDIRALPAIAPLIARNIFGLPLLTWIVRTETERLRAERWADAMVFEGFTP